MKIDRLIGILSVLLQQDMVTAPYLAERFEVSRRTINRDVEDLCRAGIPIMTMPGAGGGITIMENYKIDRTVFTTREMQDILAGLRSLDSVSGTNQYGLLMEKLSPGGSDFMEGNQSVLICLPGTRRIWPPRSRSSGRRSTAGRNWNFSTFHRKRKGKGEWKPII